MKTAALWRARDPRGHRKERHAQPLSLGPDIPGHHQRHPCRFLSVVRIYQTKYMLLTTPVSITDISFAVGDNSEVRLQATSPAASVCPLACSARKRRTGTLPTPSRGHAGPRSWAAAARYR